MYYAKAYKCCIVVAVATKGLIYKKRASRWMLLG